MALTMRKTAAVALLGAALAAGAVRADEGMWPYDQIPVKQLQERYGFTPSQEWLDHLRLSSVNMYASASFVSADGLILTNHHVARGLLQRLSSPEHNYVRDGFLAKTLEEELAVPGMTVRVLVSYEDVTAKVEGAAAKAKTPAEARTLREAAQAALEGACQKETGLKGQVVTLYGGAKYMLYRFKEYEDIRVVFAPDDQAANFGGDPDNFTFPRYDIDMALVRAYEGGTPAKVQHFLKVNPAGAKAGDLVFVSGHPGETNRLETVAMLDYKRDVSFPETLARMKELRRRLAEYSARGPEQARRAKTNIYFIDNSLKSQTGEFAGLNDAALMKVKREREEALRAALRKDPALAPMEQAWKDLEKAMAWARDHRKEILFKGGRGGRGASGAALRLVRYADEVKKPDAERLPGYHEAELADFLRGVTSPAPMYKDMEEVNLTYEFETLLKELGADDPYVKATLQGQAPAEAARAYLAGTRLDDVAYRRELVKDKGKAIAQCQDPLIALARRIDPMLRETQKMVRDQLDAVEEQALTQVARAGFAVYGNDTYPDATGTLRLAFGKVAGYPFATTQVPPFTTFYGLFDRAYSFGNQGDWELYPAALKARDSMDLSTPLNTVCTADITGGNSGSPLVDREGRLVGLIFDGNATSHANTFVYDEVTARCVSVDVRGILEALRTMYGAGHLADEMVNGKR